MASAIQLMPQLEGNEMTFVQGLVQNMTENQAQLFAQAYLARRKDPQQILIFTILGFILIAGVQRFVIGHIGMGLLYLLTGGLCLIGTIIDPFGDPIAEVRAPFAGEIWAAVESPVVETGDLLFMIAREAG